MSNDFSLSRFTRFCQRNLSSSKIFCRDLFFFRPPMTLPQTVTRRSIAKNLFQSSPRLNNYFAPHDFAPRVIPDWGESSLIE